MYYSKKDFKFQGFAKSTRQGKMYDAILKNRETGKNVRVPFGDSSMENYGDKTGLHLYPKLIHGDQKRRKAFHDRSRGFVREGYYSPGFFSLNALWT